MDTDNSVVRAQGAEARVGGGGQIGKMRDICNSVNNKKFKLKKTKDGI